MQFSHFPLLVLKMDNERVQPDQTTANTDANEAKRRLDGEQGAAAAENCTFERIRTYKDLVREIARNVRCYKYNPGVDGPCYQEKTPQRKDYDTWEQLRKAKEARDAKAAVEMELIKGALVTVMGDDPSRVFVQQDTVNDAVVSRRRTDPSIAKAIASAFFTSRRRRTLPTLPLNPLSLMSKKDPEIEGAGRYLIDNYKELLVRFAKDAFSCAEPVFYEDGQRLRKVNVNLALQYTDFETYNPIADFLHMDNQFGLETDDCMGSRYGKLVSEQDLNALLMSFCADEVYAGFEAPSASFVDWVRGRQEQSIPPDVDLSDCGTLYTDGVPVVKSEVLVRLVQILKKHHERQFFNYTEHQMINKMAKILSNATEAVLQTIPEVDLARLGVNIHEASQLQWTTANTVAFHKSPGRETVFAKRSIPPEGDTEYSRMRALSIVVADSKLEVGGFSSFSDDIYVKGGVQDPHDPSRQIELKLKVVILPSGSGAMMGEDVMD